MLYISVFCFSALVVSSNVYAQLDDPKIKKKKSVTLYKNPNPKEKETDWKATRLEFMLGGGVSGFLGDLGGQDGVSKPFVYDLEPTETRYAISAGARYFLREYHAIRGYATYARVRGDDALTSYPNRRYRNLNFKSHILEFAGIYEFHILKPNYIHFMGAKSTRIFDGNRFGAYLSAGAGLFHFNPKGKLGGEYFALHPLRTEGQEFPDGPDGYKRMAFSFPLGGGVYMIMNRNFTVGLDFGYRWTTTDYIDDASTYYYNNDAIAGRDGKLAAYFANPSVALGNEVPEPDWYTENQPRGGSNSNDTYLFLQLTLSKSFTPSVTNKKFKQKKKPKLRKSYDRKTLKLFQNRSRKTKTYNNKRIKKSKRRFKAPNLNFGKKRKKKSGVTTF
ncbi:MAG: hypothetical protein WEC59_11155 [Salibacteraceae bacterium]